MDLSALIFVALAVAWAVYLVPKALRHHDDVARSRSVDRFSHTMRVLARREPVDRRSARLVTPGRPAPQVGPSTAAPTTEAPAELTPAQLRARGTAAKRATKRRRNVLALILLANLAVIGVAAFGVVGWWYVAIPVGLLVAWLVTCRIMVKGERRALTPAARMPIEQPEETEADDAPASPVVSGDGEGADPLADTSAGMAAVVDPALWDPVPVTLPTYVGKPAAARRTVRTISLDDSGVWTSGRTEADAQLAREADEADRATRRARKDGDDQRAVGS
ncbi:hypothetical protein [Nocardioides sp.]|uniref:divisome protein SepX/GlpR n=1 Tax=Nocardioides sp. TaxID=35761 RepID=UPI002616972C|nr:hypothetical protein [Nocardioides sp.]MDI6909243.1 hypothetical protein [Nocardioides sp.]